MAANSPERKQKITIIGGGPACAYILRELYKTGAAPHLEIEIIHADKETAFGVGNLAWSTSHTKSHHLMNTYLNEPEDRAAYYKNPKVAQILSVKQMKRGEFPRTLYGAVTPVHVTPEVIERFRKEGATINIRHETSAEKIEKTADGYTITTNAGDKINTDYIVIATGHWQHKGKVAQNPGVYNSPWPANQFDDIDHNQRMAIIGSGLSAVDTIETLAQKAGRFTVSLPGGAGLMVNDGPNEEFIPRPGNENFKIDVYSRHGVLPSVLGWVDDSTLILNDEDLENLKNSQGTIPLKKVYEIMREQFIEDYEYTDDPAAKKIIAALMRYDSLDELLPLFNQEFSKRSPQKRLEDELHDALQSFEKEKPQPIPIQHFMRKMNEIIERCYRYLSAEDQQHYMNDLHPYIARYAYGMIVSNAQDLLALMKAGKLNVHELGMEYSLGTKTSEGGVKLPGAEIQYVKNYARRNEHYNVVIRATNDNLRQLKTSSPLMKSLFAGRLADDVLFPYANQNLGKQTFDAQQHDSTLPKTTIEREGKYYYSVGGMRLTEDNELTSDQFPQNSNIFTLGQPAMAYTPLFQGFGALKDASERITGAIAGRIQDKLFPAQLLEDEQSGVIFMVRPDVEGVLAIMPPGKFIPEEQQREIILRALQNQLEDGIRKVAFVPNENINPTVYRKIQEQLAKQHQESSQERK